jgi:hypothetical protein
MVVTSTEAERTKKLAVKKGKLSRIRIKVFVEIRRSCVEYGDTSFRYSMPRKKIRVSEVLLDSYLQLLRNVHVCVSDGTNLKVVDPTWEFSKSRIHSTPAEPVSRKHRAKSPKLRDTLRSMCSH